MALWLFKQEPDCYAYSQLEVDGSTMWDGVGNPLALKHLRACAAGDLAFYYHTGSEKAVVGVMEVTGLPVPDADDPKRVAVPVKPLRRLAKPVTLAAIKADAAFAAWELVRQARLSVMPVPPDLWAKVEALAAGTTAVAESEPKPIAKKAAETKK
jgi:predicted RNA-binding protein with PUA-like domain